MLFAISDQIQSLIADYGYPGIFVALMLGIIGLPVPDETLLVTVGVLASRGELSLTWAIVAAVLGSVCGISGSYILGRTAGAWLIKKVGPFLHITPQRMDRIHGWFERFGRWTLVVGYFIPGVRHLTAFAAGISRLELPVFSLFAYSGAILWSNTFIFIGYFLGHKWQKVGHLGHTVIVIAAVAVLVVGAVVGYFLHRHVRRGSEDRGPEPPRPEPPAGEPPAAPPPA